MTESEGGLDGVGAMYDQLMTLLDQRPTAVVVDTVTNEPVATYERLLYALGARKP